MINIFSAVCLLGLLCCVLLIYVKALSREDENKLHFLTNQRLNQSCTLLSRTIAFVACELMIAILLFVILFLQRADDLSRNQEYALAAFFLFLPTLGLAAGMALFMKHSGMGKDFQDAVLSVRELSIVQYVEYKGFIAKAEAINDISTDPTHIFSHILRRATDVIHDSMPASIGAAIFADSGDFIDNVRAPDRNAADKIISSLALRGDLITNDYLESTYLTTPAKVQNLRKLLQAYPLKQDGDALKETASWIMSTVVFQHVVDKSEPLELQTIPQQQHLEAKWREKMRECVGSASKTLRPPPAINNIEKLAKINGHVELVKKGEIDNFLIAPIQYVDRQIQAGAYRRGFWSRRAEVI
jgi:hypothetical protein